MVLKVYSEAEDAEERTAVIVCEQKGVVIVVEPLVLVIENEVEVKVA